MMKRIVCFLTLLGCLSLAAFAVPNVYDGQLGPREYNETAVLVQSSKTDALSNLQFAYLSWAVSPADHSVYLAVQYHCKDHTTEDGRTGIVVFINGEQIGTVYPSDSADCVVDNDRYKLVGRLDDGAWGPPYDSFCEIQVGIKFWPEGEIKAGIQILDFSGNYSIYHEETVYSPYTTTTKPDEPSETSAKAAAEKTTTEKTKTEKSTTEKSTTVKTAADKTAAPTAALTMSTTQFASPAITASPKPETTAIKSTTASAAPQSSVRTQTTIGQRSKKAVEKTTKSAAAKHKTPTETTITEGTTGSTTAETTTDSVGAAVRSGTTAIEPTASGPVSAAAANAQMYSELNKVKIVGTVLVAVILTAAIMSSVFLGMRRKEEPSGSSAPQEDHDDFG